MQLESVRGTGGVTDTLSLPKTAFRLPTHKLTYLPKSIAARKKSGRTRGEAPQGARRLGTRYRSPIRFANRPTNARTSPRVSSSITSHSLNSSAVRRSTGTAGRTAAPSDCRFPPISAERFGPLRGYSFQSANSGRHASSQRVPNVAALLWPQKTPVFYGVRDFPRLSAVSCWPATVSPRRQDFATHGRDYRALAFSRRSKFIRRLLRLIRAGRWEICSG